MNFDPNGTGHANAGIFGLPFSEEESNVVLIPVPWDVTTSYGDGTRFGANTIHQSSYQLDLCDPLLGLIYERGIFMRPFSNKWAQKSDEMKSFAKSIQKKLESGWPLTEEDQAHLNNINSCSLEINNWVRDQSLEILNSNKTPAVVGGDHSCPFGILEALKSKYQNLSILHIDAHMDLRNSYQGFEHSHASIMFNVHQKLLPEAIVQVGIRDYCPEELEYSRSQPGIHTFFDSELNLHLHHGAQWASLCEEILSPLSGHVYVSFDIDGLAPDLCPNTGTPVPGGLSFPQICTLLHKLKLSNKTIVGFDLCEVSPANSDELDCWDGNVGARILYKLCGLTS